MTDQILNRKKAFTLIELLVVVSIIAILSSVIIASLALAHQKGRLAAGQQFASEINNIEGDQANAYLDFNNCSGTVGSDASGNGNNATLVGSSSWSTDTPFATGCSLSLSGGYAVMANSSVVSYANSPFTVSLWVKLPAYQAGGVFVSSAQYAIGGYILSETYGATNGTPQFTVQSSTTQYQATGGTPLPANEWVNVVGVYDGSATMYLYVNGVLAATAACPSIAANPVPLRVGGVTQGGSWASLIGLIDNVHFYAKSLTAMDVQKNYLAERTVFLAER